MTLEAIVQQSLSQTSFGLSMCQSEHIQAATHLPNTVQVTIFFLLLANVSSLELEFERR